MPLDTSNVPHPSVLPSSPTPGRDLTVAKASVALGIPRQAFVALCEHHGILELRPFDGVQRRRFVSAAAEQAGLGWNVIPPAFLARRKGPSRGCPFALFHPARLADLAWLLGWPDIKTAVAHLPTREARRAFLLTHHAYLPDAVIGGLSGYARSTVQKARRALATH